MATKREKNYNNELDSYNKIFELKSPDYILNFLSHRSFLERFKGRIPLSPANARKRAAKDTLEKRKLKKDNLEFII